ncbi:RCC1 domain-containing protein 1 [Suncus etruscus]|uniref:RCC1 domain-containing protein 1 n=1 Tax=Suncus etruscus TaxID=109475 RepID=UPI002110689F|nr:RCC1 domain-containing protein 1 [Suncus etruscus]
MGTSQEVWFVFGFCGFGQLPGSGHGHQVLRPERLPDAEVCRVSAGWSYTAVLTRSGQVQLSGSVDGVASGCRDVWASEELLVLLRSRSGPGPRTELQAWMPAKALRGEPLWTRLLDSEGDSELDPGGDGDGHPGLLPLLPGARAYVSPQPPHYLSLGPELRARRVELGTEHVLLLDEAGQVFSWGSGRHGQLGHGTLEPTSEPRLLEALQGLRMATVAAGGWHSVCVSESGDLYAWGWNETGQLGLPAWSLRKMSGEALLDGEATAEDRTEGAGTPYISVQPFPALLDLLCGADAVAASCGSRHTAVVTRTGELFSWGWGKYGQLGHGDTASSDQPRCVQYFADQHLRVRNVSCGPWSTFVCIEEQLSTAPEARGVRNRQGLSLAASRPGLCSAALA